MLVNQPANSLSSALNEVDVSFYATNSSYLDKTFQESSIFEEVKG